MVRRRAIKDETIAMNREKVYEMVNSTFIITFEFLQVLAFQKSWRSFSPIIVCILAHCMLPF